MLLPGLARTTALALLLTACAHAGPAEPAPAAAAPSASPAPSAARAPTEPAISDQTVAQRIEFDGDEPEPPPLIRAAPKRPPLPRMQLFGTRPTDGP